MENENFEEIEVTHWKDKFFEQILSMGREFCDTIEEINEPRNYMGDKSDLPNLGYYLNNKVGELSYEFEEKNISMFSKKGNSEETPMLGDAIIIHLIKLVERGAVFFERYAKILGDVYDKDVENVKELANSKGIKRVLVSISSVFMPEEYRISYLSKKIKELDECKAEYMKVAKEIEDYDLEHDVITSVENMINGSRIYREMNLKSIKQKIKEEINPDLEKLGLKHLIPQLYKRIEEIYQKRAENEVNSKKIKIQRVKISPEQHKEIIQRCAKKEREATIKKRKNLGNKDIHQNEIPETSTLEEK